MENCLIKRNEIWKGEDSYEVLLAASKLESVQEIRQHLQPYYKNLVKVYENDYLILENDYRSGYDTYGYKNIQGSLEYISDRWGCAFRVRWLIDLINPNYVLYGGK